jgi:hypothetical protein
MNATLADIGLPAGKGNDADGICLSVAIFYLSLGKVFSATDDFVQLAPSLALLINRGGSSNR